MVRNFTQKCKGTLASFMQAWGHRLRNCYCWKGPQRIFGLYSSKLRPTEVENFLTPHSCPCRQYNWRNEKCSGHLNVKTIACHCAGFESLIPHHKPFCDKCCWYLTSQTVEPKRSRQDCNLSMLLMA